MLESEKLHRRRRMVRAYAGSILLTCCIVIPIAIIHHVFILEDFRLNMMAAPAAVSIVVGLLLGTIQALRIRLKDQSWMFRMLADASREFSCVLDTEGKYLYISPSVEAITGYSPKEFEQLQGGMDAIIFEEDRAAWQQYRNCGENRPPAIELRVICKGGEIRWISHSCRKIAQRHDMPPTLQSSNIDITARKQYEEQILRLAEYDPLTDLPNRHFLTKHLQRLLSERASSVLIFMDLRRFKLVNDAHGHTFGDKLLNMVARHFEAFCADQPHMLVGRFGGDEFFIVVEHFSEREQLAQFAEQLSMHLDHDFVINGVRVNTRTTIGIAILWEDGDTAEELIKNAGMAMYLANKESLRYKFFSDDMAKHAVARFNLESCLRDAIANNEIVLYFQPQLNLKDGSMIGAEALACWVGQDGALISPLDFISVAEETGQIIPLGRNLLEQAISQALTWYQQGSRLVVAINVSAKQFVSEGFEEEVIEMVERAGLPAELLEIELTESVLLDNPEIARAKLTRLREAGICIALDDFGTGYSSLSYLPELPLDTLKIDQSFVFGLLEDEKHRVICKTIVQLAHNMGLKVVAEGVETAEHLKVLEGYECEIGQGYFFNRPLPVAQFNELLGVENRGGM